MPLLLPRRTPQPPLTQLPHVGSCAKRTFPFAQVRQLHCSTQTFCLNVKLCISVFCCVLQAKLTASWTHDMSA